MLNLQKLRDFYQGKRVLVTGHTGFKGSCLTAMLSLLGADVYGYALPAPTEPSLFEIMYGEGASQRSRDELKLLADPGVLSEAGFPEGAFAGIRSSHIGDIRDYEELKSFYDLAEPDVVIHMAAQPLVRESYAKPRYTYDVNVMGTVNLLECVRFNPSCFSVLNVTTDKVYRNEERPGYAYREDDFLDGYDPYSNSKSCSELVTHSYKSAFLDRLDVAVCTARAGNVIGGGDFAADRIIPDCVRAYLSGSDIVVRNPGSIRPYQHVFEPLYAYLLIAMEAALDKTREGWYNVGPDRCDCVTTGELVDLFIEETGGTLRRVSPAGVSGPHEAGLLMLDNAKLKAAFGWEPVWHIREAVKASADWTRALEQGGAAAANEELLRQLRAFLNP